MDFLCSNLVKTIFTYWIGTVFNLILQLAKDKKILKRVNYWVTIGIVYNNMYRYFYMVE